MSVMRYLHEATDWVSRDIASKLEAIVSVQWLSCDIPQHGATRKSLFLHIDHNIHVPRGRKLGPDWVWALYCGLGLLAGLGAYLVKSGSGFY
jgi:hypothetical protein